MIKVILYSMIVFNYVMAYQFSTVDVNDYNVTTKFGVVKISFTSSEPEETNSYIMFNNRKIKNYNALGYSTYIHKKFIWRIHIPSEYPNENLIVVF